MKVRKEERKGFEPFTLKVTFETIEEVQELWHRLNPNFQTLKDTGCLSGEESVPIPTGDEHGDRLEPLWDMIRFVEEEE